MRLHVPNGSGKNDREKSPDHRADEATGKNALGGIQRVLASQALVHETKKLPIASSGLDHRLVLRVHNGLKGRWIPDRRPGRQTPSRYRLRPLDPPFHDVSGTRTTCRVPAGRAKKPYADHHEARPAGSRGDPRRARSPCAMSRSGTPRFRSGRRMKPENSSRLAPRLMKHQRGTKQPDSAAKTGGSGRGT